MGVQNPLVWGGRATRKTKNKNQAQNVSFSPPVCTYLTYLHGSHLTPNLGNFSAGLRQHPASQGAERERTEAAGTQAEGSQGTAYFYSWLKNISNFSKFRLFVAGRSGPRGEWGPCCAVVGLQPGRSPFPSACAWERRPLQRGREPSRSSDKTKRKMNTRIFFCC